MVGGPVNHDDTGGPAHSDTVRSSARRPGGWALWQLPKRGLVGYVIAVDVVALVGMVWALIKIPMTTTEIFPTAVLVGCTITYTELSRPIEKIRERFAGIPHIGLDTVWMFAAVLVVQPALAAVVITVSFFYRWLRVQHNPLFRRTFSTAATAVSGYAAVGFIALFSHGSFPRMPRDIPTFLIVTGAGLVFLVTNTALMTVAVYYGASHKRVRDALGSLADYALEAATIALGVLLAWTLTDWPIALLFIIGITLVLHRSVLIRQLRAQARIDAKTGLLNVTSWSEGAADELSRALRDGHHTSLLMLDLDKFKLVNDRYGHLTGDRFLLAVADTLRGEVRSGDLVGRFGGEEFVVLLPQTTGHHAHAIAERIRSCVATAAVPLGGQGDAPTAAGTVSIGVATSPAHGVTLDEVLEAADSALYEAKTAGRNRTHLAVS